MRGVRSSAGRSSSRVVGRVVALAALLVIAGCEQQPPPRLSSPNVPDEEVRNFTMTQSVVGKPEWRMAARSAAKYSERGVILARDVAIDFFDDEGQVYSHLTAREGEIQTANNDMIARGDVIVTTTNGTRVETETLRYLTEEDRIVSNDRVTVRRNGDVLTGIGFESDPSLEHFEFRREVRARVSSPGGGLQVREREGEP